MKFTYLQDVGQPSSRQRPCIGYEGLWILPKVWFMLLTNFPLWTEHFLLIPSLEESCSRLDSAGKVIPVITVVSDTQGSTPVEYRNTTVPGEKRPR